MTLKQEDYGIHFDEDMLINFMFLKTYDYMVFKSQDNGFYYAIQVEPMDDMYNDYWIDYVEHIPSPDKHDKAYAKEYEEWLKHATR